MALVIVIVSHHLMILTSPQQTSTLYKNTIHYSTTFSYPCGTAAHGDFLFVEALLRKTNYTKTSA